jgi:hypothetical protein
MARADAVVGRCIGHGGRHGAAEACLGCERTGRQVVHNTSQMARVDMKKTACGVPKLKDEHTI